MELYLTKFLIETRALMKLRRLLNIPPEMMDLGYLVHCGISQTFHGSSPRVFAVMDQDLRMNPKSNEHPRYTQVLGYTTESASALVGHARTYAEPDVLDLFDLDQIKSKPLPQDWPVGHILEFRIKMCPVIRIWRETNGAKRQVERDAWLAKVKVEEETTEIGNRVPCREIVYNEWFKALIERSRSVSLLQSHVVGFKLDSLVRKTRSDTDRNQSKRLDRPVVIIQGVLRVQDPESFNELLLRGIGRHKSFGFGMLLLKPAGAR